MRRLCGGKAIGSGTYGCVFYPGLACEGGTRQSGIVSKLMDAESAENEFEESALVRAATTVMGDELKDCFILPLAPPCTPQRLTLDDLVDVETKCAQFTGINMKLPRLRLLQQKYGGNTLEDFSISTMDAGTFGRIVIGLSDLVDAVHELNMRGVLHGDIKAANVVECTRPVPL